MVWTPEQTAVYLDFVAGHRLYLLRRLIAFRGTRRGEACGVRWEDYSAKHCFLTHRARLQRDL
ncbi:hypothetical protein [Streptomyces bauhiniae]|uniref:hypothetical protein n=1 Tax=Streptomyces bauhiniae TaxID=2340725 RepID=UPI0036465869